MERLTNNILDIFEQAKQEVSTLQLNQTEKVVICFSEFPPIKGNHYTCYLIEENQKYYYVKKQWDTEYDLVHKKWAEQGIYNLDRLRIVTKKKHLSSTQQNTLITYLKVLNEKELPVSIHNQNAIVLDGSTYYLQIQHQQTICDYQWKAVLSTINELEDIINFMLSF